MRSFWSWYTPSVPLAAAASSTPHRESDSLACQRGNENINATIPFAILRTSTLLQKSAAWSSSHHSAPLPPSRWVATGRASTALSASHGRPVAHRQLVTYLDTKMKRYSHTRYRLSQKRHVFLPDLEMKIWLSVLSLNAGILRSS